MIFLLFSLFAFAAGDDSVDCEKSRAVDPTFELVSAINSKIESDLCRHSLQLGLENDQRLSERDLGRLRAMLEGAGDNHAQLENQYAQLHSLPTNGKLSCSQVDNIRFTALAVSTRLQQLEEKLKWTSELTEALPTYGSDDDTPFVKNSLCLIDCARDHGLTSFDHSEHHACLDSCQLSPNFFQNIPNLLGNALLSPACLSNAEPLSEKNVAAFFHQLREHQRKLAGDILRSLPEKKSAIAKNAEVISQREKITSATLNRVANRSCPLDQQIGATQKASNFVFTPNRSAGTNFHFSTAKGKSFAASARHVPANGNDAYEADLDPVAEQGKGLGGIFHFSRDPGMSHFEADAVLQVIQPETTDLRLVQAGQQPRLGQNFIVAGYPLANEVKYKSVRCQFIGYGSSSEGRANGYYLYCPEKESLRGMSGGPLVDSEGRAWGIVVEHDSEANVVVATPLAHEAGKPQIGISQTFVTDLCYGEKLDKNLIAKPGRCQIFPGSLEKPVPFEK